MLYAILCYDSEDVVGAWTPEEDEAAMRRLGAVQERLAAQGRLGPVARLLPTTAATTVRKGREALVLDGPFAETKDLIAGWMAIDVDSYDRALELAAELSSAPGANGEPIHEWLELRPFMSEPPTVGE